MGRTRTSVWKHFDTVTLEGSEVEKSKCKLCEQIVSPKVERLRHHMFQYHLDVLDNETGQYED